MICNHQHNRPAGVFGEDPNGTKILNIVPGQFARFRLKRDDAIFTGINGELDAERNHHAANIQIFLFWGKGGIAGGVAFNILNIDKHAGFCFAVGAKGDDLAGSCPCGVFFKRRIADEFTKYCRTISTHPSVLV